MKKLFIIIIALVLSAGMLIAQNTKSCLSSITDIDGNIYNTVLIGTQCWFKENLKTTKYNDNTAIPLVTEDTAWKKLTTPGFCWYNNDDAAYKNEYGALYNWYAVNTGKLCPAGWHVPSDAEWTTLAGDSPVECKKCKSGITGGELKETGTSHWRSPNSGATNESGFIALPCGHRWYYGAFYSLGYGAYFASATESDYSSSIWNRTMSSFNAIVFKDYSRKEDGLSVRCIMDSSFTTQINSINYKDRLQIYPNPAIDRITIEAIPNENILSIYNINGQEIQTQQITNSKTQVDISALPCGVYYIKIVSAKNIEVRKFIKE